MRVVVAVVAALLVAAVARAQAPACAEKYPQSSWAGTGELSSQPPPPGRANRFRETLGAFLEFHAFRSQAQCGRAGRAASVGAPIEGGLMRGRSILPPWLSGEASRRRFWLYTWEGSDATSPDDFAWRVRLEERRDGATRTKVYEYSLLDTDVSASGDTLSKAKLTDSAGRDCTEDADGNWWAIVVRRPTPQLISVDEGFVSDLLAMHPPFANGTWQFGVAGRSDAENNASPITIVSSGVVGQYTNTSEPQVFTWAVDNARGLLPALTGFGQRAVDVGGAYVQMSVTVEQYDDGEGPNADFSKYIYEQPLLFLPWPWREGDETATRADVRMRPSTVDGAIERQTKLMAPCEATSEFCGVAEWSQLVSNERATCTMFTGVPTECVELTSVLTILDSSPNVSNPLVNTRYERVDCYSPRFGLCRAAVRFDNQTEFTDIASLGYLIASPATAALQPSPSSSSALLTPLSSTVVIAVATALLALVVFV